MEDMHTVECNIPEFPDYGVNDGQNIEEAIKDAFMQTDNVWKDKSFKFVNRLLHGLDMEKWIVLDV
ncbi:hypothetical protein RhiirA4_455329 [Rhizophagus irregularis]|uniref:Uncharacterized protein n=1 Tax=Rhizophagus irregularis TaxID=588596 RepID=A0A2I1G4X1_9GLOM|nr:hypothetical protein RhiirA4_455329 [Rhizophagus irregularis]